MSVFSTVSLALLTCDRRSLNLIFNFWLKQLQYKHQAQKKLAQLGSLVNSSTTEPEKNDWDLELINY
ncbi:hypothetical protein J0895_06215 [Phormidium pseudopriestleyi FRX01]|uniref:Uncharacterized protein n=1 Tax=Phormidium pseudopriestleyi FRX01 TaxID=1759528 RepID=A0ABS3FNJ8_9CYAN|nr:hypothetical protein [Phormidium pseudopriestleyi]MBO0348700.1 hypothetical protein [Phormidium pseudopriestleyi FRX01]